MQSEPTECNECGLETEDLHPMDGYEICDGCYEDAQLCKYCGGSGGGEGYYRCHHCRGTGLSAFGRRLRGERC
jgi:hypothetical protein